MRLDWLGSPELSWRDLLVIVRQAPATSAIHRAADESHEYSLQLDLLRSIELNTRTSVWQKTSNGQNGRNQPDPLRFAWEPNQRDMLKADLMTVKELAARLGWPEPGGD